VILILVSWINEKYKFLLFKNINFSYMSTEPNLRTQNVGWIEVIAGCMFSGKTEELIRRIQRVKIARQPFIIFRPKIDDRYSSSHLVSHNQNKMEAHLISQPKEILDLSHNFNVIGIDECQFFDNTIISVCNTLADQGKRVICAGLDQDYKGIAFEPVSQLLANAEYITKTLAICVICGNPASKTQRKNTNTERVLIGSSEYYEAICRSCYNEINKTGDNFN
jgi:thymidine kinase